MRLIISKISRARKRKRQGVILSEREKLTPCLRGLDLDLVDCRGLRDSARRYTENEIGNVTWEHSWNFIAGLALTASF